MWTSYVLHHVADKLAAVRELQRVLKPGRRLAIREGGLPLHSLPHDFGLGEPGWNIVCTTLKITGLPP